MTLRCFKVVLIRTFPFFFDVASGSFASHSLCLWDSRATTALALVLLRGRRLPRCFLGQRHRTRLRHSHRPPEPFVGFWCGKRVSI